MEQEALAAGRGQEFLSPSVNRVGEYKIAVPRKHG